MNIEKNIIFKKYHTRKAAIVKRLDLEDGFVINLIIL